MKYTIEIDEARGGYRLIWVCDDYIGACVGESRGVRTRADIAAEKDGEQALFIIAEVVAFEFARSLDSEDCDIDPDGIVFYSRRDAAKCLALIKAEIKAHRAGKPWPEWARTAVANGWKAPKGWTP